LEAKVRTAQQEIVLRSRLVGQHNLENLLVALGVVEALGLDLQAAARGLAAAGGAPGRLERCDGPKDDVVVFVDYAHTPDALARVLDAVRSAARGQVVCVFGCGGDRDKTKRAPMGQAVASRADRAIVTSDNPRSEDPARIAEAVVEGMSRLHHSKVIVELDRRQAIEQAILGANIGDTIVVAGKGHEALQIAGDVRRAFDDRAETRRALALRRAGNV
jgi:UDP-N-acetylmuramoyl-L-alanyl-D-glutamate--2,6-diaminopimelate ligase